MVYQIVYSSDSTTPMQLDDLEDILEQARTRNAENGITGALVYADGVFLQVIEGERKNVQQLMADILSDLRHESVTIIHEGEIPQAVFADWNMAYVSATSEQIANWAGLPNATAIHGPDTDIGLDSSRVAQVTESILTSLTSQARS